MKALLWLYHVLCLISYCCVVPQTQRQGLILTSLIPSVPPLDSSISTPWLVSISGNCQGIVLSQWWILCTANCLKKMKLSNMDISGVNYPGNILHGQRICLHPKFDPQGGKDPLKADIGLMLLKAPIEEDDISLSQAPNVSLKSCSKCQYRSCWVYQYQSSRKLGTLRVKKIPVQLLDLSICYHQHSHVKKTEGLCIQSEPQQDCWVQQGSPVLCLLKNHWELVGLIHKTSRICHNPTVIIRTNPYFTWMKKLIKASKKLLNSTSPSYCRTLHESEHVPQSRHGHKYPPALASKKPSVRLLRENLGVSPRTKHLKNSPVTFNFNDADSFPDSHEVFHEKSQIPRADKFPVEQMWTSPVATLQENPRINSAQYYQYTPLPDTDNSRDDLVASTAKSSLGKLISDSIIYNSPKTDKSKTLGFPMTNIDESWDQITSNVVKQWSPPIDDVVEPWNSYETKKIGSWAQPSDTIQTISNIGEYQDSQRPFQTGHSHEPTTSKLSRLPSFPSFATEGPEKDFNSGTSKKKMVKPWFYLVKNTSQPLSPYLFDSTWVPQPTGKVEPWSSSFEYNAAKSKGQSMPDSVTSLSHPVANTNRLPTIIASKDVPSTPNKLGPDELLVSAFEAKIPPCKGQSNTTLSQGQSSPGDRIQPVTNTEP